MPRTPPKIIQSKTQYNGFDLQIITREQMFLLTYDGKICQLRQDQTMVNHGHKYERNLWTDEAQAQSTAKKYNDFFKTTLFGYKKIV